MFGGGGGDLNQDIHGGQPFIEDYLWWGTTLDGRNKEEPTTDFTNFLHNLLASLSLVFDEIMESSAAFVV